MHNAIILGKNSRLEDYFCYLRFGVLLSLATAKVGMSRYATMSHGCHSLKKGQTLGEAGDASMAVAIETILSRVSEASQAGSCYQDSKKALANRRDGPL